MTARVTLTWSEQTWQRLLWQVAGRIDGRLRGEAEECLEEAESEEECRWEVAVWVVCLPLRRDERHLGEEGQRWSMAVGEAEEADVGRRKGLEVRSALS